MSSHQLAYAHKRRSTRVEKAVPLVVGGVGALREPYQEEVSTLSISCHGCTYQSRHEVIQGETVYLDIKPLNDGTNGFSSRARVKWVQKLGAKEKVFQVAVELELAGNVWGVPTPPVDWFPPQIPETVEASNTGRELKLVSRKDQQMVVAPENGSSRGAQAQQDKSAITPSANVPLAQLMVGFGEQIQAMASEAAANALVQEKSRLLEEFRGQLREEAVKAIQSAILASKDVIARHAMKDMTAALETGAQKNYAVWMKKIEQDMESARQHMLLQMTEMNKRADALAATTVERVHQNLETTRSEAAERFVSRLREQVVPMLAEAKETLQQLHVSEAGFKKESESIYTGLEAQLAFSASSTLAKTQEELDKNSTAVSARADETLVKLYRNIEKAAQKNVETLLASMGSQISAVLQEKTSEVSREFSSGLEGYTREYLESIGKSIAEIPQNMPARSKSK